MSGESKQPFAASSEGRVESEHGVSVLTYDPLDVAQLIASVGHESAGATAVFVGTTRNSFEGKTVSRLEYQSYSILALKTMDAILRSTCELLRSQAGHEGQARSVIRAAIHHRLGHVPVGEPSIVVAVSSPHRREAFIACERILEEVKAKAQIWKREHYKGGADEMAVWKENK